METELANLHLSPSREGRTSSNGNSNNNNNMNNSHMVRIRRKSSNISRTNSNAMFPMAPVSPTISEHSLIFERSVEDLTALPAASITTQGSTTSLSMLAKQRSNSNAYLQRQLTGESCHSTASNNMTPIMLPISASATNINNGRGSFSYSSQNTNHHHHHRRRTIENLVAPALDASCSLLADQNTALNNVNVIHSRNSSIVGLNMALGMSRSSSISEEPLDRARIMNGVENIRNSDDDSENDSISSGESSDSGDEATAQPQLRQQQQGMQRSQQRSDSRRRQNRRSIATSDSDLSPNVMSPGSHTGSISGHTTPSVSSPRYVANPADTSKVLKFYSYVDMVSDEQINPAISSRRPSFLTGSVSSPLLTPSELMQSNSVNSAVSPPPQLSTNSLLKSPTSINKRDQVPYLSPPLNSRRLSSNNALVSNSLLSRSPTYTPTATSPPSVTRYSENSKRIPKSKKTAKLSATDIKFHIESSDEFSSDEDGAFFEMDHSSNNNSDVNVSGSNPKLTQNALKGSMFQPGNVNNTQGRPRPSRSASGSFRKLTVPSSSSSAGSISPTLPSPYSLQMENLGAVLRQKVGESTGISRPGTPTGRME
ncbi:hypothetical protein DAKH74_004580 [Maudiozyma humilis]|uniref:Uncharacterized protein n=1 Tax=Maudiozyma humilis TaxID=51915 RepID=A0AAV5RT04_MAUHU|nr:hypothetical protein DAKH74_004580 [Kazachstania humilis]